MSFNIEESAAICLSRRRLLMGIAGCAGLPFLSLTDAAANPNDEVKLVERLTGVTPVESDRIRLDMPIVFPNGYTVPLAIDVDSPMTDAEHVKYIRVLAPENPLIEVATFHFMPGRGKARVSTRIRLAGPQHVVAFAEMSDGEIIMARSWVNVATNGCK